MTTAHVEKFAELVAKDLALLAKLGLDKVNADAAAAAASAAAFITNAVKEAKAHGLEFTAEEAREFMTAEARRQRVLKMLADNPALRLAVVSDGAGDPVPVAVAIRDKGSVKILIPAARFDPFALLELVERHSVH